MKKKLTIIFCSAVLLCMILGAVDYSRIKNNKLPLFMFRVSDGRGDKDSHIGLGYRFERTIKIAVNEPINNSSKLKFGLWFYMWQI